MNQAKRRLHRLDHWRTVQLYIMSAPALFWILLFCYVPMFGLIIAFKKYRFDQGIFGSQWVGFDNFKFFFKSNDFLLVTRNTLVLNFLFILVTTVAAVILALMFYELRSRAMVKAYQTVLITPNFLSWVVVSYMAYSFLQPRYGILNMLLANFGVEAPNWYATPNAWPAILSLASVWKTMGIDCIVYYAALVGMDTSMIESARIDGASRWKITKYIILPTLLSLISILTILKIGGIFRADFGLFFQLTLDSPSLYKITDVVDTYIYRSLRRYSDMGVSTAIGLLQSVIGLVMVLITNYFSNKVDKDLGLF